MLAQQAISIFTVLITAAVSDARSIVRNDKARDYLALYPSLPAMMIRPSSALPTSSVDAALFASASSVSTDDGLTYMDFYKEENCGGGVTYSTGFRAGLCLPSSDYVRPPLANDDDYPDSFPFQSLKISNITGTVGACTFRSLDLLTPCSVQHK